MSGILDNRSRIIDTVMTVEGRRQLALGGVDVQYVTFTDATTFYSADVLSGSQDATKRLYLEACQLPQDEITFRGDAAGNVEAFKNSSGVNMSSGRIVEYTLAPVTQSASTPAMQTMTTLRGDSFVEQADTLLASSIDNFRRMYLIASCDDTFDEQQFALGPDSVSYVIHDDRPLPAAASHMTHVTAHDSIMSDPRFNDKKNFRFMPPVNRLDDDSLDRSDPSAVSGHVLGLFKPMGRTHTFKLTYQQIMDELRYYADQGYSRTVVFDPSSNDNRLVGQVFERSGDSLKKLDVVDGGQHNTGNPDAPVARLFFVGKVVVDEKGTDTFIHMFTLVFE